MRDLQMFIRELWAYVVPPIANILLTICTPYGRKGQQSLASLYISSYTPTLAALIYARRPDLSTSGSGRKRSIAIDQANAMGTSKLLSISAERTNTG